jgi:hypothetical protein
MTGLSIHATNNGTAGGTNLGGFGGAVYYLIIVNTGSAPVLVNSGNQIREAASPSGITIANGTTGTMMFICDGISLFEVARTTGRDQRLNLTARLSSESSHIMGVKGLYSYLEAA